MQRILLFIVERPEEAFDVLSGRPDPLFRGISPSDFISDLMNRTGLPPRDLAQLLNVSVKTVHNWVQGLYEPLPCEQVILSLLDQYIQRDPREWPAILKQLPVAGREIITSDRIRALRKSFMMTQSEFGSLLRMARSEVSTWEHGHHPPGWCANLLLRILENTPNEAFDLFSKIPWSGEEITAERSRTVRESLHLTQEELARFLGSDFETISIIENFGTLGRSRMECIKLLYGLLAVYPQDMVRLIQALPDSPLILVEREEGDS